MSDSICCSTVIYSCLSQSGFMFLPGWNTRAACRIMPPARYPDNWTFSHQLITSLRQSFQKVTQPIDCFEISFNCQIYSLPPPPCHSPPLSLLISPTLSLPQWRFVILRNCDKWFCSSILINHIVTDISSKTWSQSLKMKWRNDRKLPPRVHLIYRCTIRKWNLGFLIMVQYNKYIQRSGQIVLVLSSGLRVPSSIFACCWKPQCVTSSTLDYAHDWLDLVRYDSFAREDQLIRDISDGSVLPFEIFPKICDTFPSRTNAGVVK